VEDQNHASPAPQKLGLIDEVIAVARQTCKPASDSWESDFRRALAALFSEPFRDGQILKADHLNQIVRRLKALEETVAGQPAKQPTQTTLVLGDENGHS